MEEELNSSISLCLITLDFILLHSGIPHVYNQLCDLIECVELRFMGTLPKITSYDITDEGKTLHFISGDIALMRFTRK